MDIPRSLLRMVGIEKSFNGIPTLKQVDFEAYSGEIHALLGANGAGKSTLMNVLSGAYSSDAGHIELHGMKLQIDQPKDARSVGIYCVYQEVDTALVPQLTVAENIMLDQMAKDTASWWVSPAHQYRQAAVACAKLGVELPLTKLVSELSLAEKQMVLIARTLVEQAKVVIFDEPTAPLSQEEAVRLFAVMQLMKEQGLVVIFISHRLPEVFAICDRITVMRDGVRVYTDHVARTSIQDVVGHMLGRTLAEQVPKQVVPIGDIVLEAKNLVAGNRVRGVNLAARKGEIVAVVGIVGAGKTETSRLLTGVDQIEQGSISIKGQSVRFKEPADAIAKGVVLVPEERRKQGLVVHESVETNLSLPILKRLSNWSGWLNGKIERQLAAEIVEKLRIKTASVQTLVQYLSGGNQQKIAIGKWLESGADVYVFDEPTKGVDVGAKEDIFQIIGGLAKQGHAILYFTCEFAEAIGIADRILVMCDGKIVQEFDRQAATQEQLLFYASAGKEGEL
ncbi:sugar ABC transporter ATP-binding protein [Paenibacillus agilis]|uniref:Sugar ABC transporter ATP-binding protein n=1 Tax=Paenibacillus agilis TaxID=3020863 RepID=A0A559J490_9BACL|nr:sugar ABC transporter ATP-binding protein [Paenibacillus agilis]TVX94626.1 sugar ABC transporter ATP-binding protein [Paenibacillus agilis]